MFYKQLNNWFTSAKRSLPFRETRNAYNIWLSEVMLQQTQVATVIDYYNRFTARFPDVYSLAEADEEEVFKLWEGLGYYSRARNLMRTARLVADTYDGIFPDNRPELLKLPGIGPYTAGAILSIAYDVPTHAVDGNVMRVMSRVFDMDADISDPKSRKLFEDVVMREMGGAPHVFNQALMELGALVCTPKKPKCATCPVQSMCAAYERDIVDKRPVKLKKIKKGKVKIAVIVAQYQGKYLIVKRPNEGLMANLWGFPNQPYETFSYGDIEAHLATEFGVESRAYADRAGKKHVFTHLIWEVQLVFAEVTKAPGTVESPEVKWLERQAFETLAFPTAFKKQFEAIDDEMEKS